MCKGPEVGLCPFQEQKNTSQCDKALGQQGGGSDSWWPRETGRGLKKKDLTP